jgi:hypothetical protein
MHRQSAHSGFDFGKFRHVFAANSLCGLPKLS